MIHTGGGSILVAPATRSLLMAHFHHPAPDDHMTSSSDGLADLNARSAHLSANPAHAAKPATCR